MSRKPAHQPQPSPQDDFDAAVIAGEAMLDALVARYHRVPWVHPDEFQPIQLPGWNAGWDDDAVARYHEAYRRHVLPPKAAS